MKTHRIQGKLYYINGILEHTMHVYTHSLSSNFRRDTNLIEMDVYTDLDLV